MWKKRLIALLLIAVGSGIGFFVYKTEVNQASKYNFRLGLDLNSGTHLVYRADTAAVAPGEVDGAMTALRDVIERRVNLFGVSEPVVQIEEGGVIGGAKEERLIVELPGVTDVNLAVRLIGQTPLLEFKLMKDTAGKTQEELEKMPLDELFTPTELTGRYLKRAQLVFDQNTGEPKVTITFNDEGERIFAAVTKANIGKVLAIFLDGVPISTPVIRNEITGGTAEISGGFKPQEAKILARDLNYGALPVPIELVSTQTIGASLGDEALKASVAAGKWAFLVIMIFLIIWYRLPGLVAGVALIFYVVINLALFKLIPVTLTAAGIGGFILSLGMAVDANILIFERMKEELRRGKLLPDAMKEGFARAWLSIRDSNLSSIITAVILYWFASTSVIKGFALVFGIGVLVSMFSAITASRLILRAVEVKGVGRVAKFLFSSGVK